MAFCVRGRPGPDGGIDKTGGGPLVEKNQFCDWQVKHTCPFVSEWFPRDHTVLVKA